MKNELMQMKARNGAKPNQRVLSLSGVLTMRTLFEFQEVVRQENTDLLILDLAEVEYIDSAGLGSLIGAFTSFQRRGKRLVLAALNERILTLLRVSNTDKLFKIYPNVPAAEAA